MLRELRIENLLLIEKVELQLGPGLNVLTGETGAGKTVLAHSLDLLMGGKARRGILRPGTAEAWVEGVFDLPDEMAADPELAPILERLPEGADELILGRRVSASGRTSAFIGGRGASAAELASLAAKLIAFYGQHEHRRLTIGSAQTAMVDGFGGPDHAKLLTEYRESWSAFRRVSADLERISGADGSERDLDLYRFELEEIEAAAIQPGESSELESERIRLQLAEELRDATVGAAGGLRGEALGETAGILGELTALRGLLTAVKGVDPEIDRLESRLESLALELDDAGQDLAAIGDRIEGDPERLLQIEERLELLTRLERKHGGSSERVLEHADWCRTEIERLEGGAQREVQLREELEVRRSELATAAERLGESRSRAARELERRIASDLPELAMDGADFSIELKPVSDGPGPAGGELAEFMLAPNPGMAAQPLRDTASGGELSRVMLALAASGAGSGDADRTLVFDEIDAGIGGNTAGVVGDRLRRVAETRQVLAITHLPQVAVRASTHFSIVKDVASEPATARVELLHGEALVAEIGRMMGATPGDEAATRHAAELLASHG